MPSEPDARALNWRFVTPETPSRLLLLPVGDERLPLALTPDRTVHGIQSALMHGPYPAVVVPDLGDWGRLAGGPARLLSELAGQVGPGGWLCTGFSNSWSPIRPTGGGHLSRRKAIRLLRTAGFGRVDAYLAFPDHRRPAYITSPGRPELRYFLRRLFLPYVGDLGGMRARLKQRALRVLRTVTLATPHWIRVRFSPSYVLVAQR
jgi:hypothetical protein